MKEEAHDIEWHLSGQILGEMPFLRGDKLRFFKKVVHVDKVTEEDLMDLKGKLAEKNPAQDPDLTLLYLADKYSKKSGQSWLVTDDFKLVQNTQKYNNDIRILTPGSFLLKLFTITDDKYLKRYFKSMEKKVTDYSIKYILSRKDIYPAAKKLSWLIDRTAALVGTDEDLHIESKSTSNVIDRRTQFISSTELSDKDLNRLKISEVYISGAVELSKSQQKSLEGIIEYLDALKSHAGKLASVKRLILEDKYEEAFDEIETLDDEILSLCIKAKFEYKKDYQFLYMVSALQIYKITFFKAYLALLQEDLFKAFNFLTETAYWAMQSHQDKALLNTVYMKAILFFFNFDNIPDFFRRALENFEYSRFLAESLADTALVMKCLLGKAISSFMVAEIDDAMMFIKMVQELSGKHPEIAVEVFSEMADYHLIFGKPEYSVFLYDEALEAAVSSNMDHKIKGLLEKMKRSYIVAGVRMNEITRGGMHLDNLIDESFDLKGQDRIEKYNDQIMKLAQLNTLLYEPFSFIYKSWTGYRDIDESLKQEFEVIDLEKVSASKSRLIAYASDLGLVAFSVPKNIELAGPPESYTLSLSKTSKVKIRQAKGALFEENLIRALIYVERVENIQLKRKVPGFLKMAG
ncbi:MAG: hypothetical protein ACTSU9_10335 [Promethearchaeota archaeon]